MGARCSNLQGFDNACALYECSNAISGQESNSTSKSDIFYVKLKPNTKFMGTEVQTAVVKTSVTPSSFRSAMNAPWIKTNNKKNVLDSLEGLEYEFLVYSNVIKPLIKQSVCPFFINVYGVAFNCSYNNITKLLTTYIGSGTLKSQALKHLKRNLGLYLNDQKSVNVENPVPVNEKINVKIAKTIQGQKIKETIEVNVKDIDPQNNLTFNMLITQNMRTTSTTFQEYLDSQFLTKKTKVLTPEQWSYFFQAAIGCYALFCSKVAHNDLHTSNVFLQDLSTPKEIHYQIENRVYRLNMNKIVRIYDFDRAYWEPLENNKNLKGLEIYSQDNYVANGKDFLKLIGIFYKDFAAPADYDSIVSLFTDDDALKQQIKNVFSQSYFLRENPKTPLNKEWYKQVLPYPEIIKRLGEKAGLTITPATSVSEGTTIHFALSTKMFDGNSLLKRETTSQQNLLMYQVKNLKTKLATVEEQINQIKNR
jgi:hypothetical protein